MFLLYNSIVHVTMSLDGAEIDNDTVSQPTIRVCDMDDLEMENEIDDSEIFTVPFYLYVVLTTVYACIFVVGVIGNSLVIAVITKDNKMRTIANFYFISLSVAGLMIILFCLPIAVYELYSDNQWILGTAMCKLVPFLQYLSVNASVLTILAIGVERFVVICAPLKARTYCANSVTCVVTMSIWLVCAVASVPGFMFSKTVENEYPSLNATVIECYTQQEGREWYTWCQTIIFYVFPGILLMIIYVAISWSLHKSPLTIEFVSLATRIVARRRESRRQLHFILWAVVVAYFICLLPFNCLVILAILIPNTLQSLGPFNLTVILAVARVLFFSNSCINPILYNAISGKFRAAFRRLVHRRSKTLARSVVSYEYASINSKNVLCNSPKVVKSVRFEPDGGAKRVNSKQTSM